MADVNISKYTTQVVRGGSKPASPGFVVSEGQNPVDPAGSGQNHLPVTIGTPANGLAVTDAQVLTIDKAQIFAGTSSQFVKGDGSLDSSTYLTTGSAAATYVPYTGATDDVNLGTHDLAAERGTFENNGSSDTLTVNHTSGSGYGIIVTKGGNNEALYVSKTSGSGNAMTVVGGRTSLVDLALSSVTDTAGDFLTLSGGVVHKRTAAQTLTDIGGQAALTNPVTGTGTTGQVAYFTGTSAISSESNLFWDATNDRLGIGTDTPGSKLQLNSSLDSTGYTTTEALSVGENLKLYQVLNYNTSIDNNGESGILLGQLFGDVAQWGISVKRTGSFVGDLIFRTRTASATSAERMRITSAGNVLVGTTTEAGFKLDVNGTGRFSDTISTTNTTVNMVMSYATSEGVVGTLSNHGLQIRTNNSTKMFITSTGNVGIGASPDTRFQINSNIDTTGYTTSQNLSGTENIKLYQIQNVNTSEDNNGETGILFSQVDGNAAQWGISVKRTGSFVGDLIFRTRTASATSAERMRITSTGNVGIGTDDPSRKLQIGDGSTNEYIRVFGIVADSFFGSDNNGTYCGNLSNIALRLLTNSTERMRITSGGNVLIGTTTDGGAKLRVNGDILIPADGRLYGNSVTVTGSRSYIELYNSSTGNINLVTGFATASIVFGTQGGTERMRISSTGVVTIANLGTGTVTATAGVLSTVSDMSYKIDDGFINSALEKVLNLKPRYFYWNEKSGLPKEVRQLGFYAQEVNEALGEEAANTPKDNNTPWGISDRSIIAMLTKAIQELKQEIDTLKN